MAPVLYEAAGDEDDFHEMCSVKKHACGECFGHHNEKHVYHQTKKAFHSLAT